MLFSFFFSCCIFGCCFIMFCIFRSCCYSSLQFCLYFGQIRLLLARLSSQFCFRLFSCFYYFLLKCAFYLEKIVFLGYVVIAQGINMDEEQIKVHWSIKRRSQYILSMCKRGPIQPYLGNEMRRAKETKESYYNLETTQWLPFPFVSRIKGLYGRL